MSLNKRIIVIICLLFFIIFIFFLTKKYENKLYEKDTDKYKIFEKENNFKLKNSNRYLKYYDKNKDLSIKDIVTRVNIGLDYNFYEYIKKADLSKNNLVLINKYNYLEKEYVPNDLEEISKDCFINSNLDVRMLKKEAKEAFEKLCISSKNSGYPIYGQSAYRSYKKQESLYNKAKDLYGIEKADSDTARAGYSEHQSGLSIDVSSNKTGNMLSFETTPSFKWIENNAYKYGFILRYPKNKENIHGYIYEPWHYRYVGYDIAKDLKFNYPNLTYDEYYDLFIDK